MFPAGTMQGAGLLLIAIRLLTANPAASAVGVGCSGGTCSPVGEGCRAQHEREEERCFPRNLESQYEHCYSHCSYTQDGADSAPLRNVNMNATVEMFPLSPRDYGMHISWYIPEEAVQAFAERLEGFEVRVSAHNSLVPCFRECIDNPDVREVTLSHLPYNDNEEWEIKVVSQPTGRTTEHSTFLQHYQVPKTCQEIDPHDRQHCGPPKYSPVPEINVTTTRGVDSDTMDVHLSWKPSRPARGTTYSTSIDYSIYPDAHVYYITVANNNFLVQNNTQATITGLDISKEYYISIQSYVNCSGLDLELKSTNIKGCSDYAYKRVSYVPVPTVTTTILKSSSLHETGATSVQAPAHSPSTAIHSVSPSPSVDTNSGQSDGGSVHITTAVSGVVFVAILFLIVIITVVVICKLKLAGRQFPWGSAERAMDLGEKGQHCKGVHSVLLIYSLDSPPKEIEAVVHYLVGGLHEYGIAVEYPENCRESIPLWVERHCEQADKILYVCNEAFHREFDENGSHGSTFVSALRNLAYPYHNQIAQSYGVILPRESYRKLIPHGYLKGASEFILDPKTVAEKIAFFVKGLPPRAH